MNSPLYFLIPPMVALLPLIFLSMALRTYQALYLLCGAALVFMSITMENAPGLPWILGALAMGEVIHFGAIALLGTRFSNANYSVFLSMLGLAPWWLGFGFSLTYLILALLFVMLYAHGKFIWAKTKSPTRVKSLKDAERKLPPEEYANFKSRALVIFSAPAMLAMALSAILFV